MARILKEKYYSASDFLHANLGQQPSYAWQNILQAKAILEAGLVWRVENGEHIKIWGDKLIFSTSSHLLHSLVKELESDAKVSALIG